MLSSWYDLLFLFCLLLFYDSLPFIGWLCVVGVFGLIECSHSLPALHSGLQLVIIIISITIQNTSFLNNNLQHIFYQELQVKSQPHSNACALGLAVPHTWVVLYEDIGLYEVVEEMLCGAVRLIHQGSEGRRAVAQLAAEHDQQVALYDVRLHTNTTGLSITNTISRSHCTMHDCTQTQQVSASPTDKTVHDKRILK